MVAPLFLLGAAVLAHEVCLLRVLAVAHWHHAASLIVAVAMLAFGASGTLLAAAPRLRRPGTVSACAGLYAAAVPLSLRAAAAVDFNALAVGWEPEQWLRLLALEAVFFAPFLLAATAVSCALALSARAPGRPYAANLAGSGAGALAAAPLLSLGPPEDVLAGVAALGCVAALFPWRPRRLVWAGVGAAGIAAFGGAGVPMSPYKALPASVVERLHETRWSARGRVDEATVAGFHHAPGLSLTAERLPPPQRALFVDGHLAGARDLGPSDYLDWTTGALPFAIVRQDEPRVLLLGVGPDLARADAVVEPNADLLELSGAPGVAADPREMLDSTRDSWDLVLLHVEPLHAAAETPMLTVEGLSLALSRAREGVAVSTDLVTPPRPGLKLLLTAEKVTPHVTAVTSGRRLTVFLRPRAPSRDELARLHAFADRCGFDVVRPLSERPPDPLHATAVPLVAPGPDYPYDVRPATDARPYFHRYFRWSRLSDLFDPDATAFVQWPFVALVVAFVQVALLGLLLVALPLLVARAARAPAAVFACLGFGFMLVEMAFLQRATVRLGDPVLAAAVVLGSFLVGSGAGSLLGRGRFLAPALAVAGLAPLGFLALPASAPLAALVCLFVAFPMGMPFPAALSRLAAPSVPWALAWNGCASVAAAAAAPLLSSTWGIPATAGGAALFYGIAAWRGRLLSSPA